MSTYKQLHHATMQEHTAANMHRELPTYWDAVGNAAAQLDAGLITRKEAVRHVRSMIDRMREFHQMQTGTGA